MRTELAPVHPAEILREEYMVPLGISINRLSRDLHVPPNRISEVVNQKRGSRPIQHFGWRDTSPQRDSFG